MDDFDFDDFDLDGLEDFDGYDSDKIDMPDENCGSSNLSVDRSSSDGTTSQIVMSNERVKRKRRRKYSDETRKLLVEMHERYKLLRPRILRTDFRRNFAPMCVNVFNSGDYRVVMEYISTYCTRDVTIYHNDHRPCNGLGLKGINRTLTGQLCLAKYWYTAMTNCPDVVCSMHNAVVKVRSDGTASVKCNFELRGNVVLSVINSSSGASSPVERSITCSDDSDGADPEIADALERYLQAKRAVQNAVCLKRRRTRKSKSAASEESTESLDHEETTDEKATSEIPDVTERDTQTLADMRTYVTPTMLVHALNKLGGTSTLTASQADAAIHALLSNPSPQARKFEPGESGGRFDMQVDDQGQVVVTACCDVVCSYDLEFNAENKVQSLVVHLVR